MLTKYPSTKLGNNKNHKMISGYAKKRKYIPDGFFEVMSSAATVGQQMGRKGGINASDINVYGLLVNKGVETTVTAKKKESNWSMTTAIHTMFVGSLDDVVVTPPVSHRDEHGNIFIMPVWTPKSTEELERLGQPNRKPSNHFASMIRPYTFISIKCEVDSSVKAGDIVRLLNIMNEAIFNGPGSTYEESAFLKAKKITKISTVTPKLFIKACEMANVFTSYLPKPDLSTILQPRTYSMNPETEIYSLLTGPNSCIEAPNGNVLILSVINDKCGFVTGKIPPAGWKYKHQKPDQILNIDEKDEDMFLSLSLGGSQRTYDPSVNTYYESEFFLKLILWNDGEIILKKTSESKWISSQIYKFAILDVKTWKSLMPIYFRFMNVVFFTRVNKKDTPRLMGNISNASSSSSSSSSYSNISIEGVDQSTLNGMEKAFEDPFGNDANEDSEDEYDNDDDDDEQGNEEGEDDGKGNKNSQGSANLPLDTSKLNRLDFAYMMYVTYISFDAKTFWSTYGLKVSPGLAHCLVKMTDQPPDRTELIQNYNLKPKETLIAEKKNRERKRSTMTVQDMRCCSLSKNIHGCKNLFKQDGRGKFVECFRVVIPWTSMKDEEDAEMYAQKISLLDEDMQTSLFLNLYNMYDTFVAGGGAGDGTGGKKRKKKGPSAQDMKKYFTPVYSIDSPEWKASPASEIYEREKGMLTFETNTPGVFAFWYDIPGQDSACEKTISMLNGNHESQRQYVSNVRGEQFYNGTGMDDEISPSPSSETNNKDEKMAIAQQEEEVIQESSEKKQKLSLSISKAIKNKGKVIPSDDGDGDDDDDDVKEPTNNSSIQESEESEET